MSTPTAGAAPSDAAPSSHDLPQPVTNGPARGRAFDWWLWLALLTTLAIVLPRSMYIAYAHSETYDEDYHLRRGIRFWQRDLGTLSMNDPPLGQGLIALPLLPFAWSVSTAGEFSAFHDLDGISPEGVRLLLAGWKSLLFLPLAGVVFHWCRRVYGLRSAWLGLALLLVEPTIGAHAPLATLDVIGVEGIVVACFLAWRFFERPGWGRLAAASAGVAGAMLLKHTAVIVPAVVLVYAAIVWAVRPLVRHDGRQAWRAQIPARLRQLAVAALLVGGFLWAFTLFDVSRPRLPRGVEWGRVERRLARHDVPAGVYVRSIFEARAHGAKGHVAYLLGDTLRTGWWYYYPVVAWYKVPVGVGIVLLLAIASLFVLRPREAEWGMAVPAVMWAAFLMAAPMNLGFRHFLPAYVFLLMLAARCAAAPGRGWRITAWAGILVAAVHTTAYLPDLLSYLNFPRDKPYLSIGDSNLDWGQSLKQVGRWAESRGDGRPVYVKYFNTPHRMAERFKRYAGDGPVLIPPGELPPAGDGWLVISPVWVTGAHAKYDVEWDVYAPLRSQEPVDVIGHSMLVYNLRQLGQIPATRPGDGPRQTE